MDRQRDVLIRALDAVNAETDLEIRASECRRLQVGTQALLWFVPGTGPRRPDVVLRLVERPLRQMREVAAVMAGLGGVCAQVLATVAFDSVDGRRVAQLVEWVPGAVLCSGRPDPSALGTAVGRLHTRLRGLGSAVDRPLTLDDGVSRLPAVFSRARLAWSKEIGEWTRSLDDPAGHQVVHGDLHAENVVVAERVRFIDFDKVMFAPREFDIAKLFATWALRVDPRIEARADLIVPFLRAYVETGQPVSLEAVQGAMVVLNASFALPSNQSRRRPTEAIARWWLREARGEFEGIRRSLSG